MAKEDRKYGHEAINKKNDSQKRKLSEEKEFDGPLDKGVADYFIEQDARHGDGKGENKERYEKRDKDAEQKERREEYADKLEEKEKHSRKF
ncbi:MAG: hypothetical protein P4L22_02550 [Candidatus Babeliales bacterium]|nr:hypothetical protein [Candidatus Babeliales bacterium]